MRREGDYTENKIAIGLAIETRGMDVLIDGGDMGSKGVCVYVCPEGPRGRVGE